MQCTIIANLILIHFSPINSQFITFFFQPEQQIWKVICGLISSSWSKIITVFSSLCTVLVFEPVQTNWISAQAKVWKCYARKVFGRKECCCDRFLFILGWACDFEKKDRNGHFAEESSPFFGCCFQTSDQRSCGIFIRLILSDRYCPAQRKP